MKLTKTKSENGYDYYTDGQYYNIVPSGQNAPSGAYRSAAYILAIKGIARLRDENEAKTYFTAK